MIRIRSALAGAAFLITLAVTLTLVQTAFAAAPAPRAEVIGIPRAITLAEAATRGRLLEAELDYNRGRLVYEVTTIAGDRMHEVVLDAVSGEIVSERPRRIEGLLRGWFRADRLSAVRASPTSLAEALAKIEAERRTRVREVGLDRERGQTVYEVELADAGQKLLIDPRTGQVRDGGFGD